MSEAQFDETIHAPVRLRICGLLRPVDHLDFAMLRDALNVSDAKLSKRLRTLTTAGYVSSSKAASAGRAIATSRGVVVIVRASAAGGMNSTRPALQ